MNKICIIDDDIKILVSFSESLSSDYTVLTLSDQEYTLDSVAEFDPDIVLLDVYLGTLNGIDILKALRLRLPGIPVVMLSGESDIETAVNAIKNGAVDFIEKPCGLSQIKQTINNTLLLNKKEKENQALKRSILANHTFIGNSKAMLEINVTLEKVASSSLSVLIRGENGVGKEIAAKRLHFLSKRISGEFVSVNCPAIPAELFESELFGYVKGAFTGAVKDTPGLIQRASGGTLFLDEIGEISYSVQVKLLHVVQERNFQRLGSTKSIDCDVRLVAATNRDLEKAVADNTFREDLYYRLNVFPVFMPSLRERRTDILLIAEFFLEKFAKENNKNITRISTSAIDMLIQYHWPGNVRELQNCMERAVIICDDNSIKGIHLPPTLQTSGQNIAENPLSLAAAVENFEKELIIEGLKKNNGNQTKTAKYLDTSLRIINYKIHQYNIEPKKYKI